MRQTISQNRSFLVPYALVFCAACFVIAYTDKIQLHVFFNNLLTPAFNFFFKYLTYVGDGLFVICVAFMILLFNLRRGLATLLAYGMSAGFAQGIKYAFFNDEDRPLIIFRNEGIPLNLVSDMIEDQHIHRSFPSGHATAAFALFFCLSFLSDKALMKFLFLLVALAVAFSRVYLSQHFFEDITAGSFIAVTFSVLVCWFFYYSRWAPKFDKIDKPLYRMF